MMQNNETVTEICFLLTKRKQNNNKNGFMTVMWVYAVLDLIVIRLERLRKSKKMC